MNYIIINEQVKYGKCISFMQYFHISSYAYLFILWKRLSEYKHAVFDKGLPFHTFFVL